MVPCGPMLLLPLGKTNSRVDIDKREVHLEQVEGAKRVYLCVRLQLDGKAGHECFLYQHQNDQEPERKERISGQFIPQLIIPRSNYQFPLK